ncbi:MAG: type II toxin-antitoxin system VapB family antitoxin [Pararhizobium sp.]
MGMSIRNPEVERLARTLADRRGISMTEAIRQALRHEIAREALVPAASDDARLERMLQIAKGAAKLKVLDNRSDDEILGYDEHGLSSR